MFPSTSAAGHAHLFDPVPSQAVVAPEVGVTSSVLSNFEVGEPSSVLSNVEVGEPSFVPEMSKIRELSSMQGFPEVRETSCIPEPFWDDGILFDQLETFLNSSPARPENANDGVCLYFASDHFVVIVFSFCLLMESITLYCFC